MIAWTPVNPQFNLVDTSIMSDSCAVEHLVAMDAMEQGRVVCGCEFWSTPDGPEPDATQHDDGSVWCNGCGGWMLDDERGGE